MAMKPKLNEQGFAHVQDGKVVYVHDDGREEAIDAAGALHAVAAVRKERDDAKDAAKTAQDTLAKLGGVSIDDALKAVQTVKNLSDKKLVEAGEVETLVKNRLTESTAAWEQEKAAIQAKVDAEAAKVRKLTVSNFFHTSPHFVSIDGKKPKTVLTPAIAESYLGQHFEPGEDGQAVRAKWPDGKPIYSRKNPAELAEPEEAIELLLDKDPNRDSIYQGVGANGTGAGPGSSQRADLSSLPPQERLRIGLAGTARR